MSGNTRQLCFIRPKERFTGADYMIMKTFTSLLGLCCLLLFSSHIAAQDEQMLYRKINTDGKEGFVNEKDEWVVQPKYDQANKWLCNKWVHVKNAGKDMIINDKGEKIDIPFANFSTRALDGYIEVNSDDESNKSALLCSCKTGEIPKKSEEKFDYLFGLGNKMYITGYEDKWMLIELNGNKQAMSFPRVSLNFSSYTGNGILTYWEPGTIGIINTNTLETYTVDTKGDMVTIGPIKEDRLIVNSFDQGSGVVDMKGEFIVPYKYDEIENFHNGYARITKYFGLSGDRYGLIDKEGKEVFPPDYASIEVVKNIGNQLEVIALDTNGTILYMDLTGKALKTREDKKAYMAKFYPDVVAEIYNCYIIGTPGNYGLITKDFDLIEPRRNFNIHPIPETNDLIAVERKMKGLMTTEDNNSSTYIFASIFDADGQTIVPDIHTDFIDPSWNGTMLINTGWRFGELNQFDRVYMDPYPIQELLSPTHDLNNNMAKYNYYATLKSALWYDNYDKEICELAIKWGIKEGDTLGITYAATVLAKNQKDPQEAYLKIISSLMDIGVKKGKLANDVLLLSYQCGAGDYYSYTAAHLAHQLHSFHLVDHIVPVDAFFEQENWVKEHPDKVTLFLENCFETYKRDKANLSKKEFKSQVEFYKKNLDKWEGYRIDVSKYKKAI